MKGCGDFIYIKNIPSFTLGHGNLVDVDVNVDVNVDAKRGDQFGYQIEKRIKYYHQNEEVTCMQA